MLPLDTVHLTAIVGLLLNVSGSSTEAYKTPHILRQHILDIQFSICVEMKEELLCYVLTTQLTSHTHTHMHTQAYTNTVVGHFISPSSVLRLSPPLFPSLINIAKPLNSPESFFIIF